MVLTICALVLFLLSKLADHYNRKYNVMYDITHVSRFVRNYWRVANAIPSLLFSASMLCAWLEVRMFPVMQILAMMLVFICALSILCVAMVCVIKTIESALDPWDINRIQYKLERVVGRFFEWLESLRSDTKNVVWALVLDTSTFVIIGAMLWNMTVTIATSTALH